MSSEPRLLFHNKGEFLKALTELFRSGGPSPQAVDQVSVSGTALAKLTNHGESRIRHCVKYDLRGDCRLVTVKN